MGDLPSWAKWISPICGLLGVGFLLLRMAAMPELAEYQFCLTAGSVIFLAAAVFVLAAGFLRVRQGTWTTEGFEWWSSPGGQYHDTTIMLTRILPEESIQPVDFDVRYREIEDAKQFWATISWRGDVVAQWSSDKDQGEIWCKRNHLRLRATEPTLKPGYELNLYMRSTGDVEVTSVKRKL